MKRKLSVLLLVLVLTLALAILPAGASAGATPVSTPEQLRAALEAGGDYVLTGDITLGDWPSVKVTKPVTLNGNGFTLSGMNVTEAVGAGNTGVSGSAYSLYHAGFIGRATASVTIKDLTFAGANVAAEKVSGVEDGYSYANGASSYGVVIGTNSAAATFENVTVTNSSVTGITKLGAYIGQNAGTLSITGGAITGCTITGEYNYAPVAGYSAKPITQIGGLTLSGNTLTFAIKDPDFNTFISADGAENTTNPAYAVYAPDSQLYTVSSDYYVLNSNPSGTVPGYEAYTICRAAITIADSFAAKIGDAYYATLAEAVAAAQPGATVTLLADVTAGGLVTNSDDSFTLNLNGHTYTINSPVGSDGTITNGMQLKKGGVIAIQNGVIQAVPEAGVKDIIKNYADLTLENVTIKKDNVSLFTIANTGKLTVNGANTVIEAPEGKWAITTGNYAAGDVITTTINDGAIDSVAIETPLWETGSATVAEDVDVVINGGTIGKIGAYDWRAEYGGEYLNAPMLTNWKLAVNGGSIGVDAFTSGAKVGSAYYASLADAVTAAQSGETITLLGDTVVSAPVVINKSIVITADAGNKPTITVENNKLFSVTASGVKFSLSNIKMATNDTESVLDKQNYFIQCSNNIVELDIDGCEFSNNYYGFAGYKLYGTVKDCAFSGIFKNYIGGVEADEALVIENNTFDGLGTIVPDIGSSAMQRSGSALDIDAGSKATAGYYGCSGSIVITGNTFTNNGSTAADTTSGNTTGAIKAKQRGLAGDTAYTGGGGFTLTLTIQNNRFYGNSRDIVLGTSNIAVTYPNTIVMSGNTAYSDADLTEAKNVAVYNFALNNTGKQTDADDPSLINAAMTASIGNVDYPTLIEAVADVKPGETITLLADASGDGVIVPSGSNFTLDFGGYTYTVNNNYAGSEGTKTQCFQLLKDSTITFKNGTIKAGASGLGMIVQNYCNLTLDNMTLDGRDLAGASWYYTLSNNCGTTLIKDSTIIAKAGEFALDSCQFGSYAIPTVTIESSAITGKIDVTGGNLIIKSGTFSSPSFLPYAQPGTYTLNTCTIPAGTEITVPAGVTVNIPADASVTNYGTIKNAGIITKAETGAFYNYGKVIGNQVNGAIEPEAIIARVEAGAAELAAPAAVVAAVEVIAEVPNEALTAPEVLETIAVVEGKYVENNTNVQPTEATSTVPGITVAEVKNAALNVPADVTVATAATVAIAPATKPEGTEAAIEDSGLTIPEDAEVIPLNITLSVGEETHVQPVAPLVISVSVNKPIAEAKNLVIAHALSTGGFEIIRPTATAAEANTSKLTFTTTSLSTFTLVEVNPEENDNTYEIRFDPVQTNISATQEVTYNIYVKRTAGTDPIGLFDLYFKFNNAALTFKSAANADGVKYEGYYADESYQGYRFYKNELSTGGWNVTSQEVLVGTITFTVGAAALEDMALIDANFTCDGGISNGTSGNLVEATTTLVTEDDLAYRVLPVAFTGKTTQTYYAKYNEVGLYTDATLAAAATLLDPVAKDNYRLKDDKWHLNINTGAEYDANAKITTALTYVSNERPEYAVTYTNTGAKAGEIAYSEGIENEKAAQDFTVKFTLPNVVAGYGIDSVSYKIGAADPQPITSENGVYTIPGESITGAVEIIVTTKAGLALADIKVDITGAGTDAAAYVGLAAANYASSKTVVRFKVANGVTGVTLTDGPTVYKSTAYEEGFEYVVLINKADLAGPVSADTVLAYLNGKITYTDTANTDIEYDYDTNLRTGARVADIQVAYDFMALTTLKYTPTDEQLLKADVNKGTYSSPFTIGSGDGVIDGQDIFAFLYEYGKFPKI